MASDLLSNLGDILGQQFGAASNKLTTLDIVQNGHVQKFGQLGDFAKQVDQTADRAYLEEGYFKNNITPTPKQLEVILQDPEVSVILKKRSFCSLAEHYRPELMDRSEQVFLKATKFLFQNKAKQIAAYELLSKIAQVSTEIGQVDYHLLPIIFGATDFLNDAPGAFADTFGGLASGISSALGNFTNVVNQVREVVALNQDFQTTTWHTDIKDTFRSTQGEGTGVLELTNILSVDTTTSLNFGEGRFSLNFSDPYELMMITNNDIEKALGDAVNPLYNNVFTQLGSIADETLNIQKQQLALERQNRRVNPINFILNPNTFLGKRVRAIIDGIGYEIKFNGSSIGDLLGNNGNNIDPSALQNSTELVSQGIGEQGLSPTEKGLFNNIISALFNQLSLMDNTRRMANYQSQDQSLDLNGVRKKLRLHYANKRIIQPMDSVSIFIRSKKKYDSKLTGGLQSAFSGLGFLQGVGNLFQDIKDTLNVYAGYSIEKSVFVGNDFPNWLWLAMRSKFVSDKDGVCVFTGVVENSTSHYSDGFHSVSVSGADNAAYFTYGLVNIKPAIDVFNGPLYDPLTPFKLDFDSVSGVQKDTVPPLLTENTGLFASTFVKNKNGLLAGVRPTEKSYLEPDQDTFNSNDIRKAFYDPDGLVYRWKEGIATLVLFGDSYNPNAGSRGPSITADPFAGQDIMNVLSLLITGQPYNYATFYKAALGFDSMRRDPITNQVSATSFFRGLRSDLQHRNAIYGDFIPFKSLIVDEASYEKMLGGQLTALNFNNSLQQLIEQRATLSDKLNLYTSSDPTTAENIKKAIANLDAQITQTNANLQTQLTSSGIGGLKIVGNDVSFDSGSSDFSSGNPSAFKPNDQTRADLQKKIAFLTRRLAWKVRANQDNNLLIVDDTYDKDYDIQAFEKALTDMSSFKSEYTTAADQIRNVAAKLNGLEVFANTQGHIEIRNPRYNRVPSSVFNRLFRIKDQTGVQVFPQFLEDLFTNQIQNMFNQISMLETQIRFYCLALGFSDDSTCQTFLNTLNGNVSSNGNFCFLSDLDGNIAQSNTIMQAQSDPQVLLGSIQGVLQNVSSQTSIQAFALKDRVSFIQAISPTSGPSSSPSLQQIQGSFATQTREVRLNNAFAKFNSQPFDFRQLYGVNNPTVKVNAIAIGDVLRITSQIASFLTDRQQAIKTAANALKNLSEGVSLNTNQGGNQVLFPNLYSSKSTPQVFAHMLEDESYDDLGVGSGSRYVIKNRDILSYELREVRPPYTSIEVKGRVDLFLANGDLPSDLAIFKDGGNALSTAAAVDYDLWRQYGITQPQSIDAPFLQDPQSQLAPYAVSLLNKARKQVHQGSLTIVGNEYQQPGEVIYMENQDLLFYVDSVSHQFSYGNQFTTSLQLGYGHNPGEYIPTPLDIIGKVLYKNNRYTPNLEHRKQSNAFNQEHVAAFAINSSATDPSEILASQYKAQNDINLQQVISQAASALALQSDTINPILEIRVYSDQENGYAISDTALAGAEAIKSLIENGGGQDNSAISIGNTKPNNNGLAAFDAQIQVVSVDSSLPGEFRYPSSKAFYLARQLVGAPSTALGLGSIASSPSAYQQQVDQSINTAIVDVWIYYRNPNT